MTSTKFKHTSKVRVIEVWVKPFVYKLGDLFVISSSNAINELFEIPLKLKNILRLMTLLNTILQNYRHFTNLHTACSRYATKLIRCVLGMTLNSSVVVQGVTVKLGPYLCFWACFNMRLCQVEGSLQGSLWMVC